MKHIFIINPCAGGEDHSQTIADEVKTMDVTAEIYITLGEKDATRYVEDYCRQHPCENVRFYACGGDGTLNEVVSGAIGHEGAEVTCYPCGSGNDYVRYWDGVDFHHIKGLIEAPAVEVDVMKVCYYDGPNLKVCYALNTMNYGFEAEVCRAMDDVRRKPFIGGRMAYTTGIAKSLFAGRHNPCRFTVDGRLWKEGDLLLASMANGRYEGGGFLSAPRSKNDDGLLEITAIRPISIVRFASIIGDYKSGKYLDRTDLQDIVSHCRGRQVTIEHDSPFYIGIDGELLRGNYFEVENLPRVLRFAVPKK